MKNSTVRSTRTGILVALLGTLLAGTATGVQAADPLDWPHWRGPEMNGISREKGIVAEWNPKGDKNVLWKSAEAGGFFFNFLLNC